jgi:hypothetical protein
MRPITFAFLRHRGTPITDVERQRVEEYTGSIEQYVDCEWELDGPGGKITWFEFNEPASIDNSCLILADYKKALAGETVIWSQGRGLYKFKRIDQQKGNNHA